MFINIFTQNVTTIEFNVTRPHHIEIDFGPAHKKPNCANRVFWNYFAHQMSIEYFYAILLAIVFAL